MRRQCESWRGLQISDERAKLTIYRDFVEGELDAPPVVAPDFEDEEGAVASSPLLARLFQLPEAMRSTTESLCSGERWLYRADIVMVLWPASSWISLIDAPAIANQEQKVCRFECQT